MHARVHTLNSCTPWFDCFFASGLDGSGCVTQRLFNPLGFSQNASAPFNGEQRISTQLPHSPPLSLGVSLYLHMSKKHCLYQLFSATPQASIWLFPSATANSSSVWLLFSSLQTTLVKQKAYFLPKKAWVTDTVASLFSPRYLAAFMGASTAEEISWK